MTKYFIMIGFLVFFLIFLLVYFFTKETVVPIAFIKDPNSSLILSIYTVMWGGAAGGVSHRAELSFNGKSKGVILKSFNKRPLTKFCVKWNGNRITIFQPLKGWPGIRSKSEKIIFNKKLYYIKYIEVASISKIETKKNIHCVSHSKAFDNELWAP